MRLIEEKGNLFDLEEKYALAHCISLDCAMGAGIAVEFCKKFPKMKYSLLLRKETYREGYSPSVMTYLYDHSIVFNLVTKERYWHKPTYESITQSINEMARLCNMNKIKYLAMPRIGSGLDRLQWDKVKRIIEEEFKDLDIEIIVRYL